MSVNMLGVEDGDQEMDDRKDIDILVKSPETSKTKKSSPSIKSFFLPKESLKTDHEPANKKDIKNFFITQNKSPTNEKTAEVQFIQDSDSNGNAAPKTEKFAEGIVTGSADTDKCPAEKQEESGNSSSKKTKPKWSLLWKPKKGKDGDWNSEDFVELSNDEEKSQNTKKSKSRKSKTDQNDATFCNKGKAKGSELKDDEKKEKKEKKTKRREVGNISMDNKNDKLKDEITIIRDDDQCLSKETIVDNEDIVEVLSDISESNDSKPPTMSSNSRTKTLRSAFDVLMSPTKSHIVDDNVKSIESVTIEDVSSPTPSPNQKSKDQVIIDCSSKSPYLESPGSGNAFDVLMTKKKPNENSSNSKKSPQKSKLNPAKFKLNIRYSRPLEFKDANDFGDDDDEILVSHEAEEQASGGGTSKKNKKEVHNERTATTKKLKEVNDDAKTQVKKAKSKAHPHQSHEKLSTKNTEPDVVSITYISEETLEVVEEPRKMTKMKNKKKKKKSKTRGSQPESFTTIEVQEDSNSSVQEVLPSDVTVTTPKTGSHHSSSEIISPGSDDFEVLPKRTGLRKRNPKNYTSLNKTKSIMVEDKKKKKEKEEEEEEKEGKDPGSPEVEMVMTCKTTKLEKDHKNTAEPKKLASIFLKKPQTIEKKEPAFDKMASTEMTQPKDDGNSKPLDEAELKAANIAFNALFATCRTTKVTVPAVQLCQLPAPWPSVSHVNQKDEDQSDEGFWKLNDSKMDLSPWKTELIQDHPRPKCRAIQLGEFTSSLNQNKNSEDVRQLIQTVSPADCLSTAAVKKVLSEVLCHFPGIPIKRLYKQYKNKEGKKEPENLTEAFKEQKEDMKAKDGKGCLSKPEERLQKGRGRPKRKISIESGDEMIEKQQKKIPRTNKKEEKITMGKVKEVENKSESSGSSRKKRGREEEDEVPNAKRKSSRLQKHSKNDKSKEESKHEEKSGESSKRKKRKTMDDEGIPKQDVDKEKRSEDSCSSLDEKRNPDKRELLWTEKYQPECSSEVMGNASSVSRLRSWLEAWKIKREKTLRKEIEMQKRLLAKQKTKDSSEKKLAWWEEDQDSDFHLSDEDSDDSGNEESGMCNAMLVVGPKGSGKTAAVYACAKELGYKVFEVNCSSKRSNKQILSRLEEATQSHLVITNPSANMPKASAFGGLFGSLSDKLANPSPMSNFFKKSNENQQKKNSKNQQSKKGVQEKSETEKDRKTKGKVNEEKGKDSAQAVGGMSESNSMPALSLKAASLILFEEVDVIFEDDKGFWLAVSSFMRNAKCPIIMTSNDSRVDCDGKYEQLMIRSPSINLLSAHLLVTALVNDIFVNPAELKTLASWYHCDIRKCLLALQFWVLSGGGGKISWEEFLRIQKDRKDPSDVQGSLEIKTDGEKQVQNPSKAGECNQSTVEQPLVLSDPGEESLFLSVDDWKTLAKRPARASQHGQQSPAGASDFQNDDESDFEPTKSSNHPPTDENTHTDSILYVNEPADSQSMQIPDSETKKVSMPDANCLLVEHALGFTNCTYGYANGCMELLRDVCITSDKDYHFKRRCQLTYNTQMMGINLVSNNLPTLLPCLHNSHSPNPRSVTKATKEVTDSGNINSMFSDKSLFDDGMSETPTKKGKKETEEKVNKEPAEKLNNPDVVAMTMEKDNDISITTQHKDIKTRKDTAVKEFQGEALEVFSSLAEDLSFMDAYVPDIATNVYSDYAATFGWWHTHARAGLSDDIITVTKHCDWSTCDTNACIRGALEAASLENSYTRYKLLVEKKQKYDGDEDLDDYLPYKEENPVVNLTGLNHTQSSKLSSRNKLYKTVSSSLPLVTRCTHHVVSVDYLPTLRSICHTERLREHANTKRRFLHYLDSNSLCINKTSQQSMADAFLAPH